MADDTRLAEACLLLNYSNQSYKEQLLLRKQSEQDPLEDRNVNIKSEPCNRTIEKILPPELATPMLPIKEYVDDKDVICEDRIGTPETDVRNPNDESEFSVPLKATNLNRMISCYDNYSDASRKPINNLLAAVNCALPVIKNRPNILQRFSSHSTIPIRPPTYSTNILDHDYCQQLDHHGSISYSSDHHHQDHTKRLVDGVEPSNKDLRFSPKPETPNLSTEGPSRSKRKQRHFNSLTSLATQNKKPLKLVAVHLGAGNSHNDSESLHLAKMICERVMLQSNGQTLNNVTSKKRKRASCYPTNYQFNSNHVGECRGHHMKVDNRLNAESAVVHLIKLMEDHQALNCGYGSNLNIRGQVECDASLMCDKTEMWSGVGAVSGCKNPILLAKSLYDHRTISRPLGLIQPNLLVGSGAKLWMRDHCSDLSIMDSKMICSRSFSIYQKLKSRYDTVLRQSADQDNIVFLSSDGFSPVLSRRDGFDDGLTDNMQITSAASAPVYMRHPIVNLSISDKNNQLSSTSLDHGFYCSKTGNNLRKTNRFAISEKESIQRLNEREEYSLNLGDQPRNFGAKQSSFSNIGFHNSEHRLDTVGAVAVDCDNNFASAISSGGLLLKCKGRIGQAAIPGAGCWSKESVAVTTTGVGEYLTLNMFAMKFYEKISTLRLLHDLGHVELRPDMSNQISGRMLECFEDLMKSTALAHVPLNDRLAGMLSVCTLNPIDKEEQSKRNDCDADDNKDLYLSYGHNTSSMCIGYMTCNDTVGQSIMSRTIRNDKTTSTDNDLPVVKTIKISLDDQSFEDIDGEHLDN